MATTLSEPEATTSVTAVTVVHWPEEASLRGALEAAGAPRLLLVQSVTDLPPLLDQLEDWVQPSSPAEEVSMRSTHLLARFRTSAPSVPVIEEGDIIRYRGRWTALPPSCVSTARALVVDFGHCVSRATLDACNETAGGRRRSCLDTHVSRLRSRLGPLGLTIRSVRGHGFILTTTVEPSVPAVAGVLTLQ